MVGLDVGLLFGGAVLIEVVFGLQGVGALSIDALTNVDLPVIVGTTLFATFFVMLSSLVVDIAYLLLDPRVRSAAGV
jgi:peptide/nickel transport system permease protein